MIETFLQEDLKTELKSIFSNQRFKKTTGELVSINIFSQNLPINDDNIEPFPYIVIKLDSGYIKDDNSPQDVKIVLEVGIYDSDENAQGYKHILNIFSKIKERFGKNPILSKKYRKINSINWALQDEDTYPFFFGALALEFNIPSLSVELNL